MSYQEQSEQEYIKCKAETIRAVLQAKGIIDLDYLIIQIGEVYSKGYDDCRKTRKEINKILKAGNK